jgi:capsular polysaccharide biosynthesis protein
VNSASVLIGPHGAGLANGVFLPEGAIMIEFAPSRYWNPCFYYLSQSLNLDHYLMRLKGTQGTELELRDADVQALFAFLTTLINTNDDRIHKHHTKLD